MADNKQNQPQQAATKAAGYTHEELQDVALEFYARRHRHGFNESAQALDAFRAAKTFLEVSAKVSAGELSADPIVEPARELLEIPVWSQQADEKWEPVIDPIRNVPVTVKAWSDPYAYAPNLPDKHPINQRFRPADGVPPSKRNGKPQAYAHN